MEKPLFGFGTSTHSLSLHELCIICRMCERTDAAAHPASAMVQMGGEGERKIQQTPASGETYKNRKIVKKKYARLHCMSMSIPCADNVLNKMMQCWRQKSKTRK